jgi:hypothetical protein
MIGLLSHTMDETARTWGCSLLNGLLYVTGQQEKWKGAPGT